MTGDFHTLSGKEKNVPYPCTPYVGFDELRPGATRVWIQVPLNLLLYAPHLHPDIKFMYATWFQTYS